MDTLTTSGHVGRRVRRRWRWIAALLAAAVAVAPAYHLLWRQHVKRFQVVEPGLLVRVAQPSEWGLRYLAERHGVKTVLNLRIEDGQLRRGWLALGAPDGEVESRFVPRLGMQPLQWPMGPEACWPWFTPWQFEAWFRLLDDPANWPVAVHCMGGRHRTGTACALYRLEYDRWPIERALDEMYAFDFGPPIALQEYNLRTYAPRPAPTAAEFRVLVHTWQSVAGAPVPRDYAELVRRLRGTQDRSAVARVLAEQLDLNGAFALPLAARLIDDVVDPLAAIAAAAAERWVDAPVTSGEAGFAAGYAAAALIADFGNPVQQARLLELLRPTADGVASRPACEALLAGVCNRYTPNRVPFLRAMLSDRRAWPAAVGVPLRVCDVAVVRLSAIADRRLLDAGSVPTLADWDRGRQAAEQWLEEHPERAQLSRLLPPAGHTVLLR